MVGKEGGGPGQQDGRGFLACHQQRHELVPQGLQAQALALVILGQQQVVQQALQGSKQDVGRKDATPLGDEPGGHLPSSCGMAGASWPTTKQHHGLMLQAQTSHNVCLGQQQSKTAKQPLRLSRASGKAARGRWLSSPAVFF